MFRIGFVYVHLSLFCINTLVLPNRFDVGLLSTRARFPSSTHEMLPGCLEDWDLSPRMPVLDPLCLNSDLASPDICQRSLVADFLSLPSAFAVPKQLRPHAKMQHHQPQCNNVRDVMQPVCVCHPIQRGIYRKHKEQHVRCPPASSQLRHHNT